MRSIAELRSSNEQLFRLNGFDPNRLDRSEFLFVLVNLLMDQCLALDHDCEGLEKEVAAYEKFFEEKLGYKPTYDINGDELFIKELETKA